MTSNRKGLASNGTYTSQGKTDSPLHTMWDTPSNNTSPMTYVVWTLLAGILLVIAYFVIVG